MKLTLKPIALSVFAAGIGSLGMTSVAQADDAFFEALTGGKVSFSARARYEAVEQDTKKDSDAFTLRSTLGYKTGDFKGFSGFVEFEDITDLADSDYFDGVSGDNTYAAIVDPEETEVNQAYLQFNGFDTEFKLGRQELTYRDAPFHRFIGNVLWRQNHQSFDAFSFTNTSLADTKLSYAYINKVQGIKADVTPMDSHLFNIQYSGLPIGTLEGYGYFLEYEAAASASKSSKTLGLRLSGAQPVNEDFKVIYTAEFAKQDDYKDGVMDDQNYYLAELGGKYKGWLAKLSYEVQEGEGLGSFKTPLGTNHAFQGWADVFLATPDAGLEDMYVTVVGNILGAKVIASYHDFETDVGSVDAGEEFDILVSKKFAKHYTVGAKYSDYQAGDLTGTGILDTKKFWLWGEVKF